MTPLHQLENFPSDQNAYKWKALSIVALGTIMGTMDSSIANIALPILTRVFQAELATVMWVSLAYTLVSTGFMLILGKISDLKGRKKIYIAGMSIFTLGLIACSLSQSIGQLILSRMLQAVGGCMIISCGTAVVIEAFPPQERGRGLGLLSISVSIGFIIGPILGGFLLSWLNWRSIFYTRIPVGLITLFMAIALLKKDPKKAGEIELDLLGSLMSSVGLACLIFGVSQINKFGLKSPLVYLLIGLGLLSLIGFIFVELRAKDPVVDLSLFKNRHFSCATWSLFLLCVTYPASILLMPFYLMYGIGLSSSATGLLMTVASITNIVVAPISGWLSDRFAPAYFSTLGAGAGTAALYFMIGFDLNTTLTAIILVLALSGLGIGIFHPPNSNTILGAVPNDRLGTASALLATLRYSGLTLGTALAGTIFSLGRVSYNRELALRGLDKGYAANLSISLAFREALLIAIFIGALAVLLSLAPAKWKTSNN